jgi:hippurate hydrolase
MRSDLSHLQDDLVRLRRELHRIPEVGLQVPRTQERVLAALDGLPLEVTTGTATTSVTAGAARWRGGRRTGGAAARRHGRASGRGAHRPRLRRRRASACTPAGHDLHTTMLVGAAQALCAQKDALAGDVVFMFQPGEEGYDGAGRMIDEGVLGAAGRQADASYALHVTVRDAAVRLFATRPGR